MGPRVHEIFRLIVCNALRAIDVGLIMAAFCAAAVLSVSAPEWTAAKDLLSSKVSLSSCVLLAFAILSCYGVFSACGLYKSKRLSSKGSEVADVLRAMAFSTACLWLESRAFYIGLITPIFLAVFAALGSTLVVLMRLLLRFALGAIRKRGCNLHHVLVLGTNSRAVEFARQIERTPGRGCRLIGFVDDEWQGSSEIQKFGFPLACGQKEVAEFLRRNVVDEVAIYLPLRSFYERAAEVASLAKQHGILVRFDPNIFDLKFSQLNAEALGGPPQITAESSEIGGWPFLFKRVVDIVLSLISLVMLSPLFLVVGLLIKMTSSGPVFFAQRRVGLNKREFTMFKFRTMVHNAEQIQERLAHLNEMTGPAFKIKKDPRVTPLGRILRKTSIDELPQLFNVLRGDMSLVGPRAMSVRDYRLFSEDWQRRRFSVPPGITCLWQVCGRNNVPFEQWMLLDMQYIDKWSLWLDFKILAQTIPAVIKGVGAG